MNQPPEIYAEHTNSRPWSLLTVIALSIFFVEMLIMLFFERWPIQSPLLFGLTDALLLTLIVFPVLYFFDFRPLVDMRQKLHTSEESFKSIFVNSFDGILAVNREGYILFANDVAIKLMNRPESDLVGTLFGMPITAGSVTQLEVLGQQSHLRVLEMQVLNSIWDGRSAFLVSLHDVTEYIDKTEKLHKQSISDELTGLKNRRGFYLLAEQQMKLANRSGDLLLFYIDLDDMKHINDTYGHKAGDQALIDVTHILTHSFRDSDIIGRLGGDEFAVVAIATDGDSEKMMSERLTRRLEAHNLQADPDYRLQISYGVVRYDHSGSENLDSLLASADALMYSQKQDKKNSGKRKVNRG